MVSQLSVATDVRQSTTASKSTVNAPLKSLSQASLNNNPQVPTPTEEEPDHQGQDNKIPLSIAEILNNNPQVPTPTEEEPDHQGQDNEIPLSIADLDWIGFV